jgi:hypothetical protein
MPQEAVSKSRNENKQNREDMDKMGRREESRSWLATKHPGLLTA